MSEFSLCGITSHFTRSAASPAPGAWPRGLVSSLAAGAEAEPAVRLAPSAQLLPGLDPSLPFKQENGPWGPGWEPELSRGQLTVSEGPRL